MPLTTIPGNEVGTEDGSAGRQSKSDISGPRLASNEPKGRTLFSPRQHSGRRDRQQPGGADGVHLLGIAGTCAVMTVGLIMPETRSRVMAAARAGTRPMVGAPANFCTTFAGHVMERCTAA